MTATEAGTSAVEAAGRRQQPVTVLGLGAMGSALARAFVKAGHPTTVWNRTPGRADALVADGAVLAPTVRDALSASPLTVICVLDDNAVHELLAPLLGALHGQTLINLTSSTPERARATAAWAERHGAAYLDGAIMVPTPLVGSSDALVLYSGSPEVFSAHEATLRALAADSEYLGTDAGSAAIHDLAMLDVFFAGMTSFLHATALVGRDGITAASFLPYAQRILSLLNPTFAELAAEVDAGSHPGDLDNLEMEAAAVDHIIEASAARGISTAVPEVVRSLIGEAVDRGHGRDGFSRVVDLLRSSTPPVPVNPDGSSSGRPGD